MVGQRGSMPGPWRRMSSGALALGVVLAMPSTDARRTIRDPVAQRRDAIPTGVTIVRDVAYGTDRKQRFDVYKPKGARNAPVVLMVHGGAWRTGDKRSRGVVGRKVERWSRAGIVVISVNYRIVGALAPTRERLSCLAEA